MTATLDENLNQSGSTEPVCRSAMAVGRWPTIQTASIVIPALNKANRQSGGFRNVSSNSRVKVAAAASHTDSGATDSGARYNGSLIADIDNADTAYGPAGTVVLVISRSEMPISIAQPISEPVIGSEAPTGPISGGCRNIAVA